MDARNHNQGLKGAPSQRSQTIALPNDREGIGNALRSAFDSGRWNLPEDMRQLLSRLDR